MSQAMSEENSDDGPTRTTIEVDREVWRHVRSKAVADGSNVSEKLEEILRDHFDMEDANNE